MTAPSETKTEVFRRVRGVGNSHEHGHTRINKRNRMTMFCLGNCLKKHGVIKSHNLSQQHVPRWKQSLFTAYHVRPLRYIC